MSIVNSSKSGYLFMRNLIDLQSIQPQSTRQSRDIYQGRGSEFDMKYHVVHDFITSTPFEEKSSDHFKDLHKMELLTNFDISLTSFLGGVMN